ncbi:MAG: hypothetical protein KGD73_09715 [Candidatus Lokiarchaeota archaeon]|nr:hypothetical protein [Candidatus Lokiarchaeota archaeon]
MPKQELICENCGENPNQVFYECIECANQLCDNCVNICPHCNGALCDGCYQDHKKNCK